MPATRSAVRRRPSLPRPVRVRTARPPSAATSGSVPSYTGGARRPQSASEDFRPFTKRDRDGRTGGRAGGAARGDAGLVGGGPVWSGVAETDGPAEWIGGPGGR
ncbi:hypothetical protein GCM10010385_69260 [Streptomyces geysiriensis]|nr:hypothetical protein GCM10010385_69260 [Streptomyces geysiriensis]